MDIIHDKTRASLDPDDDGNLTIEYGDFPVYGDGRTDHRGVTKREVINAATGELVRTEWI
jgi:hypothetical protein